MEKMTQAEQQEMGATVDFLQKKQDAELKNAYEAGEVVTEMKEKYEALGHAVDRAEAQEFSARQMAWDSVLVYQKANKEWMQYHSGEYGCNLQLKRFNRGPK